MEKGAEIILKGLLQGQHINQAQVELVGRIERIKELDDLQMADEGTRLAGWNDMVHPSHDTDFSSISLKGSISKEYFSATALVDLFNKYKLNKYFDPPLDYPAENQIKASFDCGSIDVKDNPRHKHTIYKVHLNFYRKLIG